MKKLYFLITLSILFLSLSIFCISGCDDNNGVISVATPTPTSGTGTIEINIQWPTLPPTVSP